MFLFLFVEPYMWFVVNIHLLPDGLNEYQLQSFIAHNMLSNLPFYLATYIPVASSWISHYRIITYLHTRAHRGQRFYVVDHHHDCTQVSTALC